MSIPVRNVYYLLLYAWNRIGEGEEALVGGEDLTRLQDLLGHVLTGTVSRLLTHGLDRLYGTRHEALAGIRGKLDLSGTVKRNLLINARSWCQFDELEHDVVQNRILKATLRRLAAADVSREVRDRARRLYGKLDTVSDIRITRGDFASVQLHRNNRLYAFALDVCRLIHENLLIESEGGRFRFRDFRDDDPTMAAVFEQFVYNFFRREQSRYEVGRPTIRWNDAEAPNGGLPQMHPDVVLRNANRVLIIDMKYYRQALSGRFDDRVRSSHLYQMFAYTENWAANSPNGPPVESMLLYPVVRNPFSFDFRLKGRRITVRSINLDQDWREIRDDLLFLAAR